MIKILSLLTLLISFSLQARPENVEVWYLSSATAANDFNLGFGLFKSYVNLGNIAYRPICEEVDGKCYDPHIGIYEKGMHRKVLNGSRRVKKSKTQAKDKKKKSKIKSIDNSISFAGGGIHQTNLITCDTRYYFDFYCGSSSVTGGVNNESSKKANVELWIDTSSSLNLIDIPKSGQKCYRQLFYEKVSNVCKEKLYVHKYDTSLKELSGGGDLCFNYGLNNTKKLINWIDESDAKNLIIITDIGEYDYIMISYLLEIGAKLRGQERGKAITAPAIVGMWKEVAKKCN